MIAVADSSPLIILAKLGYFELLHGIFSRLYISTHVHREVVVSGAGLPGAAEVANADWIERKELHNQREFVALRERYALGAREVSTIVLAKEISAGIVLLDDRDARRLARAHNLEVRGTLGLLETFYLSGHLSDLRATFQRLSEHSYVDKGLLDRRLRELGLRAL